MYHKMADDIGTNGEGVRVGTITHYFDKISVAVVKPEETMNVGDTIRVLDREGNVVLEQVVSSMEIDRVAQESVPAGQEFGMKVDGEVKEGYVVVRV